MPTWVFFTTAGTMLIQVSGGLVIANLSHLPFAITLVPREHVQREWTHIPASVRRQCSSLRGTPYAVRIELLMSPGGA
jgi:hypothetical protein